VSTAKRSPATPEVPTMQEAGVANFESAAWQMIVAPAGTPADVIQRLNGEVAKALTQPTLLATLEAEGSVPMGATPAQAASFIRSEQAKWASLIREAGIKGE
jgi:tripartite-type tricarboxylate transporter receptor subunit TctC